MSVYIHGMEMPISCFECKLLDYTDTYKCRVRFESLSREHGINISRPDWCPLVPVPEHGRLIDADTLTKTFLERKRPTLSAGADGSKERVRYLDYFSARQTIKDAPTIIPAEEGET